MQLKLIFNGPRIVNEHVMQLTPWQPNFQPAFACLTMVAVWIQLHHLLVELWEGGILETISAQFGKLLKINDLTLILSKTKYARVCVELDLSQPDNHRVFIVAFYEKLPAFCYHCDVVGHRIGACK